MCSIAKYLPSLYKQFMNQLFELNGFWYPMRWLVISGQSRFDLGGCNVRDGGNHATVHRGYLIYVRFLVALCREGKTRRIGYWVRVRLGFAEESIPEPRQRERPVTRAA